MNRNLKLMGVSLAASLLLVGLAGCEIPGAAGGNQQQQQKDGDQQNQTGTSIHEGNITEDQTWKKADGPHIIRGSVYVESESGVTLTIEPGTEIRFEAEASLHFGYHSGTRGVLLAKGTTDAPIRFTSVSSSPQKGDWGTLYLGNGASSSILEYCEVRYGGGGGSDTAALTVYGSNNKPTVKYCTIEGSAAYGISLDGDASFKVFENNLVKGAVGFPIRGGINAIGSLGVGNAFEDNPKAAIYVNSGTVSASATWRNFGIPYRLFNQNYVESEDSTPVLTIEPGCTLEFGQDAGLNVGFHSGTQGALYAVGTEQKPITFTGVAKTAGSWEGLYFSEGTIPGVEGNTSTTVLQHALIEYGAANSDSGLLTLYSAKPLVKDVTFRHSGSGKGIYLTGDQSKNPSTTQLHTQNTYEDMSVMEVYVDM